MDSAEVIEKLKIYKELLAKHMKFDEMILFGSYARSNASYDSDVDIAVVVKKNYWRLFFYQTIIMEN